MDCDEAKKLIDEKVHLARVGRGRIDDGGVDGDCDEGAAQSDQSDEDRAADLVALDEHLAACPTCAADYTELLHTRELVVTLADDAPIEEEIERMWSAIDAAAAPLGSRGIKRRRLSTLVPLALSSLGVAAVLALAFVVGEGVSPPSAPFIYPLMGSEANETELSTAETTRAYWALVRSGDATIKQYLTFSSGAEPDPTEDLDRYYDFRGFGNISYGYQVPFGPPGDRDDGRSSAGVGTDIIAARSVFGIFTDMGADDSLGKGTKSIDAYERRGKVAGAAGEVYKPGERFVDLDGDGRWDGPVEGRYTSGDRTRFGDDPVPGIDASKFNAPTGTSAPAFERRLSFSNEPADIEALGFEDLRTAKDAEAPATELDFTTAASEHGFAGARSISKPLASELPTRQMLPAVPGAFDGADLYTMYSSRKMLSEAGKPAIPGVVTARNLLGARFFEFSPTVPKLTGLPAVAGARDAADWYTQEASESLQQSEPPTTQQPVGPQPLPPSAGPKIIKTGQLDLEVESFATAAARVDQLTREAGAFLADASTQELTGGALSGRLVIRVLPENFDALYVALKSVGRLISENAKAADVTADYVDLEARIKSHKISETRLQELIKNKTNIDKVEDLLKVERELTRVRSQIEQLQGQLRVMADRIGLSTITLTLHEPGRPVPTATLSLEVPILDDAATALGEALTRLNGRMISGHTSKQGNGIFVGSYDLTIGLVNFNELLSAIGALGRVQEQQVSDRAFGLAQEAWASRVECKVSLSIRERSRQLPSGTVQIEVATIGDAIEQLNTTLETIGGSITSNNTTRRNDGSSTASLQLQVPAGRFEDLLNGLAALGRTTGKQVQGEAGRIVGGAANVPSTVSLSLSEPVRQVVSGSMVVEVQAFESARDRLSRIISDDGVQVLSSGSTQRTDGTWVGGFRLGIKAAQMESLVASLEDLGRVASRQINGLGLGDLSQADPDALGVIALTLGEKAAISPEPQRAGGSIRNQLRDGLAGFYTSLGYIVRGLITIAPWAVIIVICAWPITRWIRKRRLADAPGT